MAFDLIVRNYLLLKTRAGSSSSSCNKVPRNEDNLSQYVENLADRKVKTIAGRLVRELQRKLAAESYSDELDLFQRVLGQNRQDKNKVYSLYEPEVVSISKGKEHKKYELGSKVSITVFI